MSDCHIDIAIHKTPGSSRTNRLIDAISPDFAAIDERKIKDLIMATNRLSSQLHFYNQDNNILGNWGTFFQWETTSILAQIAAIDIDQFALDYRLKRRKLLLLNNTDDSIAILIPFFDSLDNLIKDLIRKIEYLPEDIEIKTYYQTTYPKIESLIAGILAEVQAVGGESMPDYWARMLFLVQHHLFNNKLQNLLGLLTNWKDQGLKTLLANLESYEGHSPQYGLYLAFLQLFENAQQDINEFTKRHLDFYYKSVLRLSPGAAKPDYVHLSIEPHKNAAHFLIEKDRIFLAGKNTEGQNKYYAATADSAINQAKLEAIFGGLKTGNTYYFEDLTDQNATGESWKPFPKNNISEGLGFAVASRFLLLKGGHRTITITFTDSNDNSINVDPDAYLFFLSGEEEWLQVDVIKEGNVLKMVLMPEEVAIVPFNPELHQGVQLNTAFPVLKIVTRDGRLKNVDFSKINLTVTVFDYQQFSLYTSNGLVDHTKPFQPFGPIPRKGLGLIFSCNEFFQKAGAEGRFDLSSDNESWSIYDDGTTNLFVLENGIWEEETRWSEEIASNIINERPIPFEFAENQVISPSQTNGFAKIVLTDDDYKREKYLEDFIEGSQMPTPALPYIPTINEVNFGYTAACENDSIDFFQLHPQGYQQLEKDRFSLLPTIGHEGELIFGIKEVKPGNSVSLLFQLAEGTANPRQVPADVSWSYLQDNKWCKFKAENIGDETVGLTQSGLVQLITPENLSLLNQTIFPADMWWIKIEVPARVDAICDFVGIHPQSFKAVLFDMEETGIYFTENTPANTISKLLKPKNEIKALVQHYDSFGGNLKASDTLFYQQCCERLRNKDKAITTWDYEKLVLDNFKEVFSVKCLNHHRYDMSEVNNTAAGEITNTAAGYITIIPVAAAKTSDIPDYWKPLVSIGTMKQIKEFLQIKTSPHVRINVKPPQLERLELDFRVRYKVVPGADSRLYTQQLEEVINTYLSPWAYEDNTSISFQTELEKSRLLQLVEQQTYVDYIMDFKVNHLILEESSDAVKLPMNDVEKIVPKTAFTLFVPGEHNIEPITKPCCK